MNADTLAKDKLQAIQDGFELTSSGFAHRLGTTRLFFADLANGKSVPTPEQQTIIDNLYSAVLELKEAGGIGLADLVHINLFSGKSLLNLIFDGEHTPDQILTLKNEAPYLVNTEEPDDVISKDDFDKDKILPFLIPPSAEDYKNG